MLADWQRERDRAAAGVQRQPAPARPCRFLHRAARRPSPTPACRCRCSSSRSPRRRRCNARADVLEEIAALRADGATIAIDDFGTGYSNLARLRAMPLDRVKLDPSLIADIDDQREGADRRPGGDPADQGRGLRRSSPRRSRTSRRPTSCARWAATRCRAMSSPQPMPRTISSPGSRNAERGRAVGRPKPSAFVDDPLRRSAPAPRCPPTAALRRPCACVALGRPKSTTGQSSIRKRPSDVPPLVDSSGSIPVSRGSRRRPGRRARRAGSGTPRQRSCAVTRRAGRFALRRFARPCATRSAPAMQVVEADVEPRRGAARE